jgi:glutathione peroxidase
VNALSRPSGATTKADLLYHIDLATIEGVPQRMDVYRGRTLLIVNVASRCGFTPQYEGLERLYRKHKDRGFVVLAFPCDQFGHQEPGTDTQIKDFCAREYDVTFPVFAKTDVNGDRAHPLFKFLKSARKGRLGVGRIAWNFTKFLVDREGNVVERYSSRHTPERIEGTIVKVLATT